MCLLEIPKTKFYILTPFSTQNANFWPIFDATENFESKGLNIGDNHLLTTLNRHRSLI